jgi:hypothetical protein
VAKINRLISEKLNESPINPNKKEVPKEESAVYNPTCSY